MGFTYRKRSKKDGNVSFSSRGLRYSRTIDFGMFKLNLGHTFGGTNDGKTTSRLSTNLGNGVTYVKTKTLKTPAVNNDSVMDVFEKATEVIPESVSESQWFMNRWVKLLAVIGFFVLPFLPFKYSQYLKLVPWEYFIFTCISVSAFISATGIMFFLQDYPDDDHESRWHEYVPNAVLYLAFIPAFIYSRILLVFSSIGIGFLVLKYSWILLTLTVFPIFGMFFSWVAT